MKKYKQLYLEFFEYNELDFIPCEMCGKEAVDIHHIDARGMGGRESVNVVENLMALCRECHNKYGDIKYFKGFLKHIHNKKVKVKKNANN